MSRHVNDVSKLAQLITELQCNETEAQLIGALLSKGIPLDAVVDAAPHWNVDVHRVNVPLDAPIGTPHSVYSLGDVMLHTHTPDPNCRICGKTPAEIMEEPSATEGDIR
jgi:hypothetical protein